MKGCMAWWVWVAPEERTHPALGRQEFFPLYHDLDSVRRQWMGHPPHFPTPRTKKGHSEVSATLLATPSEARESNSLLGNNLTLSPACQGLHAPHPEPTLNPCLE